MPWPSIVATSQRTALLSTTKAAFGTVDHGRPSKLYGFGFVSGRSRVCTRSIAGGASRRDATEEPFGRTTWSCIGWWSVPPCIHKPWDGTQYWNDTKEDPFSHPPQSQQRQHQCSDRIGIPDDELFFSTLLVQLNEELVELVGTIRACPH